MISLRCPTHPTPLSYYLKGGSCSSIHVVVLTSSFMTLGCCLLQVHVQRSKLTFSKSRILVTFHFNPLTPVPPVTARAETHPQFPVPPVTARKKACEDNCLSYPPWRWFGPPIVLLLLRTNKPIRMDFPSIFLEDFRGPRKTVFRLKIMRSKSAGNHGALQDKSTNFQALVFIRKTEKLLLWHLKWKGKT